MPPISLLIKPASGMCNMKCDYCFYSDETKKRKVQNYGFMSIETLKNVMRKTIPRAEGMISIAFQGGEPTLRGIEFFEEVIEFEKKYNKNHVIIQNSIQTNGYMLDEKWCTFLKKNNFLVGISVDGTKQIHDSLRHGADGFSKTYDRILGATWLMEQHGVEYNILTVVSSEAAKSARRIYEDYKRNGWRYQQYIPCLDPLNEEHGLRAYSLSPRAYGGFLTELFACWYRDYQQGKNPYIRQFENYIGIMKGYQPESCDMRGCCSVQYVVEANGSVYPCDFYVLDGYKLGNLNEERLDEIDARRNSIGFINESRMIDPQCGECDYYYLCRGGCRRLRDKEERTGFYKNYFCESYKMLFDSMTHVTHNNYS